jgi:hypothetical protein
LVHARLDATRTHRSKLRSVLLSDGKLLGNKASLENQIHQVTGIAIGALRGTPLVQFSIDERLSWTEKRETTVEEDAAYCLLGIFNIHIPLIYGEGRQNALARLQKEIEEKTRFSERHGMYIEDFIWTGR